MTQPGLPPPPNPELDRLLSDIYIRMRQEKFAEANERLARAKEMAPEHPAVIEMEGDLAAAQGRVHTAQQLYKQAHELDPQNAKLEEKYATALLRVSMPELMAHQVQVPDDSPWSSRVPRNPLVTPLQSALLPGFGQLYNGDWLKGLVVMLTAIFCGIAELRIITNVIYECKRAGEVVSTLTVLAEAMRGSGALLALFLFALWLYAVLDAWLVARHTSSSSGHP